jgi:hypothetical protein
MTLMSLYVWRKKNGQKNINRDNQDYLVVYFDLILIVDIYILFFIGSLCRCF